MSDRLIFVSGKGFVKESSLQSPEDANMANRDETTLDIMVSIQNELNQANIDKQRSIDLLNAFRLDLYPTDIVTANDGKLRVKQFIADLLEKDENGINRAELFIKHTRDLCAMVSNLVEDYRSKANIKVKRTKADSDAMNLVDRVRKTPRAPKKGPEKYTDEQKIIANLRKSPITKRMNQSDIVKVIIAMNPSLTEEYVRTEIERQIAKETVARTAQEKRMATPEKA